MIYVASPYSHPSHAVMAHRYSRTLKYLAYLHSHGETVAYSPIVGNHILATEFSLPTGWAHWRENDLFFIEHATSLVILGLPGWEDSRGVSEELKKAVELGIPRFVVFDDPEAGYPKVPLP